MSFRPFTINVDVGIPHSRVIFHTLGSLWQAYRDNGLLRRKIEFLTILVAYLDQVVRELESTEGRALVERALRNIRSALERVEHSPVRRAVDAHGLLAALVAMQDELQVTLVAVQTLANLELRDTLRNANIDTNVPSTNHQSDHPRTSNAERDPQGITLGSQVTPQGSPGAPGYPRGSWGKVRPEGGRAWGGRAGGRIYIHIYREIYTYIYIHIYIYI